MSNECTNTSSGSAPASWSASTPSKIRRIAQINATELVLGEGLDHVLQQKDQDENDEPQYRLLSAFMC